VNVEQLVQLLNPNQEELNANTTVAGGTFKERQGTAEASRRTRTFLHNPHIK